LSVQNEEEFVIIVVLVPVVFTLYDPEANNAVVHFSEGLIEPLVLTFPNHLIDVDLFKMVEFDVEFGNVVILIGHNV
jgi:hypothetical protein